MAKAVKSKKLRAKWVYAFGGKHADGSAEDRNLLGGKGAFLAEMSRLGLPVPPGFTISTEVCHVYYESEPGAAGQVEGHGQPRRSTLSARSRARASAM